jgi:DNA-binding SARP family transcriptional activator
VSGGALSLARGVRVDVREMAQWAQFMLDPRGDIPDPWPGDEELRGELLPGWYDDWVLLERERLRQLRLYALEALADKLAQNGRYGEAVQAAHAAVRIEPLRETARRILVRIHRAEGNLAEAIRTYESFREVLAAEIGASPSARMEALLAGLRCPSARHPVVRSPAVRRSAAARRRLAGR